MQPDVSPIPKDNFGECACGCGEGVYRVKAWVDGRHIRPCDCRRCMGARNRRQGLRKQSAARKRLGVAPQKFGDANEENWGDNVFANEVKSGGQISPAVTAWLRIEGQVLANRADHGDLRKPCRAVLMPNGWGAEGLVMVRLSTWEELVRPALEEFYGPEVAS